MALRRASKSPSAISVTPSCGLMMFSCVFAFGIGSPFQLNLETELGRVIKTGIDTSGCKCKPDRVQPSKDDRLPYATNRHHRLEKGDPPSPLNRSNANCWLGA